MKRHSSIWIISLLVIALFISACSRPTGRASGTHKGGKAHVDLFKLSLPISGQNHYE